MVVANSEDVFKCKSRADRIKKPLSYWSSTLESVEKSYEMTHNDFLDVV